MKRAAAFALVALGCGGSPAPVATPTGEPAPSASVPDAGASGAQTACVSDADCTFVSLGCCSTTPVNRASAAAVKMRLAASGLPYCAVKAACGPGPDGTWEGAPGTCMRGACSGAP